MIFVIDFSKHEQMQMDYFYGKLILSPGQAECGGTLV